MPHRVVRALARANAGLAGIGLATCLALPLAAWAQSTDDHRPIPAGDAGGQPVGEGGQPASESSASGHAAAASGETPGEKPGETATANRGKPNYDFEIDAPAELKALIERQTLIGRWRFRPEYQPDQFDALYLRLQEEVETLLRSQGYFDFEVKTSGDSRRVRVEVNAGARTTVNRVELKLTGAVSGFPEFEKRLRERWQLPEGTFYNSANWESSKRYLLEGLRQLGFLRSRIVSSQATADVRNTTVALEIEVDSGPRLSFGHLQLKGLERYDAKIIENLRPFRVGEPYDFDTLMLFQTRLRDSGYFASAYVIADQQAVENDPKLDLVPVRVELTERESKRLMLGIGFSTDQGARGQVGLQHRNLFGLGWRFDSGIIVEKLRQRLYGTVRTPTDATGHYFSFGGRSDRQDIQGEEVYKNTLWGGRGKLLNNLESFTSLQYQTERRIIENIAGGSTEDDRRALTLGYSWNYRMLDSRIDPRHGYTVSAQLSGAVKGIATDASFARIYTRAMRFQPIDPESPATSGILIGLIEIGHVFANARSDVMTENLFRAGGAHSIRGYDYQSIGVREGAAIVGGRSLAVASLEYQHPIGKGLWLAGFTDVGNAVDRFADFKALWGYGVGLRWRTPIGPISLDVAYGDADRRWRAHFSVGYAF